MENAPKRVVVKGPSRRDIAIAVAIGALVLGLLIVAMMQMNRSATGAYATGKILSKEFTPAPQETEITIGKSGLSERVTDGEYVLKVHVSRENKTYDVVVGKDQFERSKIGDDIQFRR